MKQEFHRHQSGEWITKRPHTRGKLPRSGTNNSPDPRVGRTVTPHSHSTGHWTLAWVVGIGLFPSRWSGDRAIGLRPGAGRGAAARRGARSRLTNSLSRSREPVPTPLAKPSRWPAQAQWETRARAHLWRLLFLVLKLSAHRAGDRLMTRAADDSMGTARGPCHHDGRWFIGFCFFIPLPTIDVTTCERAGATAVRVMTDKKSWKLHEIDGARSSINRGSKRSSLGRRGRWGMLPPPPLSRRTRSARSYIVILSSTIDISVTLR